MKSNRSIARLLGAVFSFLTLSVLLAAIALLVLDIHLPRAWDPREPLTITDPVTPLTRWKLGRALSQTDTCMTALQTGARFQPRPDFEASEMCHIKDQVALQSVAGVALSAVNTRCQTALRTAMWMQHGILPAAQNQLGQGVQRLHHLSSYNCRPIRTSAGTGTRMSTHSTAEAIDISGVTLTDGTRIMLLGGWSSADPATRSFFRQTQRSACTWFRTVLGPDYNRLHADHFHLQHTGWGTCR